MFVMCLTRDSCDLLSKLLAMSVSTPYHSGIKTFGFVPGKKETNFVIHFRIIEPIYLQYY